MVGVGQQTKGGLNPERISLGFGALFANPGDHIGHFYRTRKEWKDLTIPFLRIGLEAQDKCVCLVRPGASHEEILSGLQADGIDVQAALSSEQLVLSEGFATTSELRNLLKNATYYVNNSSEMIPDFAG